MLQVSGLSLEWVITCLFKLKACIKDLSHVLQVNGLLLAWLAMCFFRAFACLKDVLHVLHTSKRFALVRISLCLFRRDSKWKVLSHVLSVNNCLVWVSMCLARTEARFFLLVDLRDFFFQI